MIYGKYEMATGRMLAKLFADCRPAHSRIVWDVLHPLEQGEGIEETFHFIREQVAHVHIKDGIPWPDPDRADWNYTVVGEGAVPLKEFVKLMLDSRYDGYFSLEWEPMWRPELRGLELEQAEIIGKYARFMREITEYDEKE